MTRLYRSRTDKKLFGVCGGIAQNLGVDSTLVRLAVVLLIVFTGIPLVLYFLMAVIMPKEPLIQAFSMDRELYGAAYSTYGAPDLDRDIDRIEKQALQEEVHRLRSELAKLR